MNPVAQAIERRLQSLTRGETDQPTQVDDLAPYGGGDPDLADAIARDMASRWDD